jgi:hypothetical protein
MISLMMTAILQEFSKHEIAWDFIGGYAFDETAARLPDLP